MTHRRRPVSVPGGAIAVALIVLLLSACGSSSSSSSHASTAGNKSAATSSGKLQPITLAYAPENVYLLPLFIALQNGDFAKAGLTVNPVIFRGSSETEIPALAEGKFDIANVVPDASLFNSAAQGFGIKVITTMGVLTPGRASPAWLMLTHKAVGKIKTFADLKGASIEGALQGTPIALLAQQAVADAGLSTSQVQLTYRVKTPQDMVALAAKQASDVISMIEPVATLAMAQGYVTRWKSMADVMPWYQPSLLGASAHALSSKYASVVRFMQVYLAVCRQINATNGKWTPQLLTAAAAALKVPAKVIEAEGAVPYFDPTGTVSTSGLRRLRGIYASDLMNPSINVSKLVDMAPADQAAAALAHGG